MFKRIKQALIGKPLDNEEIHGQKYSIVLGLPILASDAVSSVAYASEEILYVLVPVIGVMAYRQLSFISVAIILLLLILTFSYRQTIKAYPSGGGAFIVASDNLGTIPGVTAGAALAVDYILTVAVSVSSGTAAITSAFPALHPYTVPICLIILTMIMLGNLRGIKESSQIFSIPTYMFILTMVVTIVFGIIKYITGGAQAAVTTAPVLEATQPLTLMLLLSAFANGCSALTGVEAVSNAIPNFAEPQVKNAQRVLLLLSGFVLLLFGGTSILANLYHTVPMEGNTVLSQIATAIYGNSIMYYIVQATTAIILVMAANTSYSDFPLLMSLISSQGFAPRQLTHRGDRLSFSNGILALSAFAAILLVVFRGSTNALIPLYAVGVFISFTLSQFGMFRHWLKRKSEGHWLHKAVINGFGSVITAIVAVIIAVTKFKHGAWIVIIVIPVLVTAMLNVKKHYSTIARQLRLESEDLCNTNIDRGCRNRVIVPIASINKASIRALRYAKTISDNVVAFNVSIDPESVEKLQKRYEMLGTEIPLIVKYSPYRKIYEPLLEFIESEEYNLQKSDMITVILPQFVVRNGWQRVLHNGSGRLIAKKLLKHSNIVVASLPLQLKDDSLVECGM